MSFRNCSLLKVITKDLVGSRVIPTIKVSLSSRAIHYDAHLRSPDNSIPWYMRPEESPKVNSPLKPAEMPTLPENSPDSLTTVVTYLATKLGITDIKVFDMRDDNDTSANEGAKDIANFMVIGTGKSPKHLQKASTFLDFYLKHHFHEHPATEGLVGSNAMARARRRLKKKGKGSPQYAKYDYGASANTWIMTDCKTDGIYVHMLTSERRDDLNLELLWAKDKSKYRKQENTINDDNVLSGLRYYHTMRRAGTRSVSSVAFDPRIMTRDNYRNRFNDLKEKHLKDPQNTPLVLIQHHFDAMVSNGLALTVDDVYQYIDLVFQSPEFYNGLKADIDVFNKRYHYAVYILKRYAPLPSGKAGIKKLLPLLAVSGSQFDNEDFITLDKLSTYSNKKLEEKSHKTFKYSPVVHKLYQYSQFLTGKKLDSDGFQHTMDLLCLTIFVNRKNWVYTKKVLENAIKRDEYEVLRAAFHLVAVKGDMVFSEEFLDRYYPLLALHKEFSMDEEARFLKMMLTHGDPVGTHYEQIRKTL